MNKKFSFTDIALCVLIVLVVFVSAYLLFINKKVSDLSNSINEKNASVKKDGAITGSGNFELANGSGNSIPASGLKIYSNTKFGYTVEYADNILVDKRIEMDPDDLLVSSNIEFYIPGQETLMVIDELTADGLSMPNKSLFDAANSIRQEQLDNDNPNGRSMVGKLNKIMLDGKDAYSFTLMGGFKSKNGEYDLGDGSEYTYVFVRNGGHEFLIHYLNSDKSLKVFNSFRFKK